MTTTTTTTTSIVGYLASKYSAKALAEMAADLVKAIRRRRKAEFVVAMTSHLHTLTAATILAEKLANAARMAVSLAADRYIEKEPVPAPEMPVYKSDVRTLRGLRAVWNQKSDRDSYFVNPGEFDDHRLFNHEDRGQDAFLPETHKIEETRDHLGRIAGVVVTPASEYETKKALRENGLSCLEEIPPAQVAAFWKLVQDRTYQSTCDYIESVSTPMSFGDAWDGMGEHAANMSGLNRMILEDCHDGSGRVQRQGMNVPNLGKARKVEVLARDLGCTLDQAEDLMDFWTIIDDSGHTWGKLKSWTVKGGIDKALTYFEGLAGALVDDMPNFKGNIDTKGNPTRHAARLETVEPYYATIDGLTSAHAPLGNNAQAWEEVEDPKTGEEIVLTDLADLADVNRAWDAMTASLVPVHSAGIDPDLFQGFLDRYTYQITHRVQVGVDLEQNEYGGIDETPVFEDWPAIIMDKGFSAPPVFRYSQINYQDAKSVSPPFRGENNQLNHTPYRERMPEPAEFDATMATIETAKLAELNALAKSVGGDKALPWMDRIQRSAFWNRLKTRQNMLNLAKNQYVAGLMGNLSKVEKRALSEMRNAKSTKQAKFYWYQIYAALEGKVDLGRKGFVEYVLKPELHARQELLKARPAQPETPAPSYDVPIEAYGYIAELEA
ncbi:MAG: hypothetical protein JEZ11_03950 [Desulfobacterales bacterium]|nr:hypothetical protein [Desulfobacterales bacterium]